MEKLPSYLKDYANNCVQKRETTVFNIKCSCGNEKFRIVRGRTNEEKKSEERWNNYWRKFRFIPILEFSDAIERKTGRRYTYGTTFFGIRVGKYYDEIIDMVQDIRMVKSRCLKCSKDIVLFDNRKHGYDAIANLYDSRENRVEIPYADETELKFRNVCKDKDCTITVAVQNDLTKEEFCETFGDNESAEIYSNAFTWIKIFATANGKKHTVLDMETA